MKKEVKIPEIAENVETGILASILVSEGDKVTSGQALVEVETDKAATEIPSEYDGVVKEIKVKEGDEIKVNQVIIILEVESDDDKGSGNEDESDKDQKKQSDDSESKSKKAESESEKEDTDSIESNSESKKKEQDSEEVEESNNSEKKDKPDNENQVAASPLAKRIAREHDVDLSKVQGTGPRNRISRNDVEEYINSDSSQDKSGSDDEAKNQSRKSLSTIEKITAKTMQEAWQTIPHVTQFDEADITELENFRKKREWKIQEKGGKLTITSILLKISGFALQKFPRFNASLDWENKEIIFKQNYNIGVAVDTSRGLLVPVVTDVHRKSLTELSVELSELSKKARDKKISPEEMKDGNFTISNLGGIGGTGFTPIVYPPQVAILGVSRAKYKQVLVNDEFEKRLILPVSLSYDHRVINGADGARFLRWICNVLEDPYAILF